MLKADWEKTETIAAGGPLPKPGRPGETGTKAEDNAAIAARIHTKLLRRLESEIDALPERLGTESTQERVETDKESGKRKMAARRTRLRDLTAAYKELAAGINLSETDIEDIETTRAEVYGDEEPEL